MAAPAIGVRKRWSPGLNAQIDWSHPLAAGLLGYWLAAGGWVMSLVHPSADLAIGGNPNRSIRATPWGYGVAVDDTSSTVTAGAFQCTTPSASLKPTDRVSMMWVGALLGTTASSSNPRLFSMDYTNNPSTNPFVAYAIYRKTSTSVCMAINSAGTFAETTAATTPSAGEGIVIGTYDRTTATVSWNTTARGTTSASGAITYGASPRLYIGNPEISGSARGGNIATTATAVWGRALSDADRADLQADPCCMLRS